MKWEGNRESDNVEDRRGDDDGGGASGGFGGSGIGGGHIGIGSIVIALVASYFLGVNPLTVLGLLSGGSPAPTHVQSQPTGHRPDSANEDRMTKFVRTILADTEDTWGQIFTAGGAKYVNPGLVIYTGATRTGCGAGEAAMGPFYCPADQKVYIDLAFYQTLKNQLGAGGEFAQAYVIAHEVGHHVQNLLGISGKVDAARHGGVGKDALEFRTKTDVAVLDVVVERLDAHAVAGQQQATLGLNPDGDGKHATKALEAGWPPMQESVENNLSVAVGLEGDAERLQLSAECAMVIDFSVEGDDRVAIRAEHGLIAAVQVHNTQAGCAK